ncbi:protein mono-ADP-ribosyltransferase PARP14-like [Anguilla rostrata]|uniref:protein mono-ADP-ribosyltransferase PARP14-like n=1 Tax=Anguilla rostrata TaxID=7938 RepID=UPI0030D20429
MEDYQYPVTVTGEWGSNPPKVIKNKLQIYFQSKKKSGGGDCHVEFTGRCATVHFKSEDARERVLAKEDHELAVSDETKLRLSLCAEYPQEAVPGAGVGDSKTAESGVLEDIQTDSVEHGQATAVLLENVPEKLTRELLGLTVENICSVSERDYSLEVIRDVSAAVVTFIHPAAAERFRSRCGGHSRLQQYQLRCRVLEPSCSVWVEDLPPQAEPEVLELYFEKDRVADIRLIPDQQAAVVTFQDPKAAEAVLQRTHRIYRVPVRVYPYEPDLRTPLYGPDRPEWQLPEPVTESLHPALGNFLLLEDQQTAISASMRTLFCQVELSSAHAKLRPLPGLLKQPGLTANRMEAWRGDAARAFRDALARYRCIECPVSAGVWKEAESEIRQAVGKRAILLPNLPSGAVAIAGLAEEVERIQGSVERIVQRAAARLERERDGMSEEIVLSPGMHHLLQQAGLGPAAQRYPGLGVSYSSEAGRLVLRGLPAEVLALKSWVLERRLEMRQRPVELQPELRAFLSDAGCEELSRQLFTAGGVGAVCQVENEGPVLLGASEQALSKAGRLLQEALGCESVEVEDEAVLLTPEWAELRTRLAGVRDSAGRSRLCIQPGRRGGVSVAGFRREVKEATERLAEFLKEYSRTEEAVPLRSIATLVFLRDHKASAWRRQAEAEGVRVRFQRGGRRGGPRVVLAGARLRVQGLKGLFSQLDSALFTDQLTVVKPGARKYFLEEKLSSVLMKEKGCLVVLQDEGKQEEEEEEEEGGGAECVQVETESGVLVTVGRADITRFAGDAVVNAANEDLRHYGGLAGALLEAAGQALQDASDAYVRAHGPLRPGDAAITAAGRLPCRHVVHAVGPRYSSSDPARSVELLARAVRRSLALAERHGCVSIALPAVSSGIFGFPLERCADTIARAVREHCQERRPASSSLAKIHLLNNDDRTVRAMAQAVRTMFTDMRPQALSQPRKSPGPERKRERTAPRAAEWNSPPERPWSSADHSWDKPSESRGELETKHTKEGLLIVLRRGNIEDAATDVIVNTISADLDLSMGAVSKALLQAAGPELQGAVRRQGGGGGVAEYGAVLHTDGFRLSSDIFHTVCPPWDSGLGKAQEMLIHMVKVCLMDAEKQRAKSLAFPAIGTGNLGFPKPLVAKIMLSEVQAFSHKRAPRHLRKVVFMVHPSDAQSVECFVREFRGQAPGHRGPSRPPSSQSQQEKFHAGQSQRAFFGLVSSPTLGSRMTPSHLPECVNSSNDTFSLKTGVSKAILDAAGPDVEDECAQLGSQPHNGLIVTRSGNLRCENIIHTVVQSDPANIRGVVLQVLQVCEQMKASSVAFPAFGTGQGGVSPPLVAEAMISAVADFVKKTGRHLKSVKIVIFQPEMVSDFHKSMKKREGGDLPVEKNIITKAIEKVSSFLMPGGGESRNEEERFVLKREGFASEREGFASEREGFASEREGFALEGEEFSPAVFELCGESSGAVWGTCDELKRLLMKEQTEQILRDPGVALLTPRHRHALQELQRRLTVRIQLESQSGLPCVRLEGLTHDVRTAESCVRRMIREAEEAEEAESRRREAVRLQERVEWRYEDRGTFRPFDLHTNLTLERAFENQQVLLRIYINDIEHEVDLVRKKACAYGKEVALRRRELRDDFYGPRP